MKILLIVLLLIAVVGANIYAQDPSANDRTLGELRGTWEFHTFFKKSVLVFKNDRVLRFDREDAVYILLPGVIRVERKEGSVRYPFRLNGNDLVLTLPDGSERTYERTEAGRSEALVRGKFIGASDGVDPPEYIVFDGGRFFTLFAHDAVDGTMFSETGIFRVEADRALLTFDDRTLDEAQILYRNSDRSAAGMLYHHQFFQTEQLPESNIPVDDPVINPVYIPIPIVADPPAPDHPVIIGGPRPHPNPPHTSQPPPKHEATGSDREKQKDPPHRILGPSRGDKRQLF